MILQNNGDFAMCDFPNCSNHSIGDFPIIDNDGEDQGCENLCAHHAPYKSKPFLTEVPMTGDKELNRAIIEHNLALVELQQAADRALKSSKEALLALSTEFNRIHKSL